MPSWLQEVWDYGLLSVDGRLVTPGKLAVGLAFFIAGYLASRAISSQLSKRLPARISADAGAVAAVRSLTFYALLVVSFTLALKIANVPLTAFAFLGGALAIGIGFGSQNIVNNFISGLILLIERPIKVGDFIQVGNTFGTVERVGPRSTRVRAIDHTHVIVPNSFFLENHVLNWTLSDDVVRTSVEVGVAYGSDVRKVMSLMKEAVEAHSKVLNERQPVVLLAGFGDNAIQFECLFWVRIRALVDRRVVQSEIRIRVNELFHEAGIVIAFPQRDIHLDIARPVDVRVLASTLPSE